MTRFLLSSSADIPEAVRLAIGDQVRSATEALAKRNPTDLSAHDAAKRLFRRLKRVVRGSSAQEQLSWMISFNDHPRPDANIDLDALLGFFAVRVERQGDVLMNRIAPLRFRSPRAPLASLHRANTLSPELQPFAFDLELTPPQFSCRSFVSGNPASPSSAHRFDAVLDDMMQRKAGVSLLFYEAARRRFVSHGPLVGPFPFEAAISAKLLIRV